MEVLTPYFLYPSTIFIGEKPHQITTILGSCVAVCLWDPVLKAGGINHYMLPWWNGEGLASPKYGNIAIEKLLEKLLLFSSKRHLKAKIFGGAQMSKEHYSYNNIGQRNIETAEIILKKEGIPIIGASVGGNLGRKIMFNTESGVVLMKYVNKQ